MALPVFARVESPPSWRSPEKSRVRLPCGAVREREAVEEEFVNLTVYLKGVEAFLVGFVRLLDSYDYFSSRVHTRQNVPGTCSLALSQRRQVERRRLGW